MATQEIHHDIELAENTLHTEKVSMLRQPMAVWATAIAAMFAFMGIGLVDPILPDIAKNLKAGPEDVSLLFTSYFLINAIAMLGTGWVSSRIGAKKTLLIGLGVIVIFSSLSGTSGDVWSLVGFRAGWGLGNALFIATALAVIVGVASGGAGTAIILYEAAMGLGLSLGPLFGALLGGWQWRLPFFGTAVAMLVAFIACLTLLPRQAKPTQKTRLRDPLLALGHKGLRYTAGSALFYNFGFFTILAYVPFILGMNGYGIGAVFFGWGVCLAICSVFIAPLLQRRFGTTRVITATLIILAIVIAVIGFAADRSVPLVVVMVILGGACLGVNNTMYTELAMEVSDSPRSVASAAYNFVRWLGGAIAPFVAAQLGEHLNHSIPFFVAAVVVLVGAVIVISARSYLVAHEPVGLEVAAK